MPYLRQYQYRSRASPTSRSQIWSGCLNWTTLGERVPIVVLGANTRVSRANHE
jgi:hypothetical protein